MKRRVALASIELDLHVHAVAKRLRERYDCDASVIAFDIAHKSCHLNLDGASIISDYAGKKVDISEFDVIWWRRANQPQLLSEFVEDEATHELISREWRFAHQTAFFEAARGIWINQPWADILASSKTAQLRTAAKCGLITPKTLISNSFEDVIRFYNEIGKNAIVKKIAGVPGKPFATLHLLDEHLIRENIELCPAVYQEYVHALKHHRVCVFGRDTFSISIEAADLDWRRDLNGTMRASILPDDVQLASISLVRKLGLRMGIIDLIETTTGDFVFLEVNPQGQFLFAEALSGVDLTEACANFLANARIEDEPRLQRLGDA